MMHAPRGQRQTLDQDAAQFAGREAINERLRMLRGALRSTGLMVAEDAHFGTSSDLGYLILSFAEQVEGIQDMVDAAAPGAPGMGGPQV